MEISFFTAVTELLVSKASPPSVKIINNWFQLHLLTKKVSYWLAVMMKNNNDCHAAKCSTYACKNRIFLYATAKSSMSSLEFLFYFQFLHLSGSLNKLTTSEGNSVILLHFLLPWRWLLCGKAFNFQKGKIRISQSAKSLSFSSPYAPTLASQSPFKQAWFMSNALCSSV